MNSQIKSSQKTDQYFWKENFESFEMKEAVRYHEGVTKYPFTLKLYDKLIEQLLSSILPGKTPLHILDAGGGTGKWAKYFAAQGHQVTLMDVAEPMLEVARQTIAEEGLLDKVTIETGTIVNLTYPENNFDFIFSDRNPISHCGKKDDSYQSIQELYRVLKPGGKILGCVLNRLRKVAQMAMELDLDRALRLVEEGDIQRGTQEYSHYYLIDELRQILQSSGFQNIRIYPTTVFTELVPTAWLLDEIPLEKFLQLELKMRDYPEMLSYGVRFHFSAEK